MQWISNLLVSIWHSKIHERMGITQVAAQRRKHDKMKGIPHLILHVEVNEDWISKFSPTSADEMKHRQ